MLRHICIWATFAMLAAAEGRISVLQQAGLSDEAELLKAAQQLRTQGRFAEAEPLLLKAWAVVDAKFGGKSPEVASLLGDLARTERGMGKGKVAQMYMEKAVQIRQEGVGAPMLLAKDLSMLGLLLAEDKKEDAAVKAYRDSVSIMEREMGTEAPELLPALDAIGGILRSSLRYDEAVPVYLRALNIREATFGPSDSELLGTLDSLSYVYFGQRNFELAEPVYRRLLALWESAAGPEHPMVALTLEKMAEFYLEQERTEEAACAADRALDLRQRAMTVSLLQVGKVALRYGAVREAESAYRRAVDLAPTRALKTRSGYDFATVLRRLGKTAEADAVSSRAAAIE